MKKILFLALSLFISYQNCFAYSSDDPVTSGYMGLIIVSTSARDDNRSWGDKYNANFRVTASSVNTLNTRLNNVADSTSTLNGLSTNIVYSSGIVDNGILGVDLGSQIVLSTHIGQSVVTGGNISSNTITGKNILADTVVQLGSATFSGTVRVSSLNSVGTIASTSGFTVGASTVNGNFVATKLFGDGSGLTGLTGGDPSVISTFTFTLGSGGDIYTSTSSFIAIPGVFWSVYRDTVVFIDVQPFVLNNSTIGDTVMSVMRSTATGNSNTNVSISSVAWGNFQPIDASSYTVKNGQKYGATVATSAVVNASETLALWVVSSPSSGTIPSEYGVNIRYYKRRQ